MIKDLNQIKLIIWDLDETLWDGTISEQKVLLKKQYGNFIKNTLDMGIVHSICSKNDFDTAKQELVKIGLWDLFVFPSINWQPKGARVKNIIDSMSLRAVNTLFVDDNPQNLNEAKYFCPEISVALPDELENLFQIAEMSEKKDCQHKRLQQYKVLQNKAEEKNTFSSNEDFLFSCNIQVEIKDDCIKNSERLHELIIRSNQLNYTKKRPQKNEFEDLLADSEANCGYVQVKDRFGDYGIVGFFAIKNNTLIHYVFSCRTLGMRVEQYVYMQLKCPHLEVVDDVVSQLNTNEMPQWINQTHTNHLQNEQTKVLKHSLLLKGPCDMSQIFSFFQESENIVGEFSYTNEQGILTEGHNHTSQIVTALESNEKEKAEILSQFKWLDKACLDTTMISGKYDFIVLSMLTDGNLGIYRNKKNGKCISLCERYYDMTSIENRNKYINGEIFTSNIHFSEEELVLFSDTYEYVDNSDAEITISNLQRIRQMIPQNTKLALILGSERGFPGKIKPSYKNRHLFHKMMNEKILHWSKEWDNVVLIPIDKFIHAQSDFLDTNNHFIKRVYYDLAQEVLRIADISNDACKHSSSLSLALQATFQRLRILKNKWK